MVNIRSALRRSLDALTASAIGKRFLEGVINAAPGKVGDYLRFGYYDWYLRKVPDEVWADQRSYWNRQGQVRWRKSRSYKYDQLVAFIGNHIRSEDRSLIDLGCGAGEALSNIHDQFPDLYLCGVDISDSMIRRAKLLQPKIHFIRSSFGPGLQIGSFDILITRAALPCISEGDLQSILDWMSTVSTRLIILSELVFEGNLFDAEGRALERITNWSYRRPYDGTFVRDYTRYTIPGFSLIAVEREGGESGCCNYLFQRDH